MILLLLMCIINEMCDINIEMIIINVNEYY